VNGGQKPAVVLWSGYFQRYWDACWIRKSEDQVVQAERASQQTPFGPILWSSCLAMFAVGANSTAIMAALPSMRTALSLSPAGVEWAVNSYLVVAAAFIVLGGQAADRFGARPASIAGLALFGFASASLPRLAKKLSC
jgi:Major Facilitator Superfamily